MQHELDANPACINRHYNSALYKSKSVHMTSTQRLPSTIQNYYLDIKAMNPKQLDYFKKYAKFENMRPRDYINWLYLNKDKLNDYDKYIYTLHKEGYDILQSDVPPKRDKNADKIRRENKVLDDIKGTFI
jgi:hypothetical protein